MILDGYTANAEITFRVLLAVLHYIRNNDKVVLNCSPSARLTKWRYERNLILKFL
jgi:hypothetical protein